MNEVTKYKNANMKFINDTVEFDFNRACEDCHDDECKGDCCICTNEYCSGECRGVNDYFGYCYCTDPEDTCYCDNYYIIATPDDHIVFVTGDLSTAKQVYANTVEIEDAGNVTLYCAYLGQELSSELEIVRNVKPIFKAGWSPSVDLYGVFDGITLKYLTPSPYDAKNYMLDVAKDNLVCKIIKTNECIYV